MANLEEALKQFETLIRKIFGEKGGWDKEVEGWREIDKE